MAIPLTMTQAKDQLQVGDMDPSRDAEIAGFIDDAAAWVEEYTGHILVARDVVERFDTFERLRLKAWPIKPDAVVGIGYSSSTGAPTNLYGARISSSARPVVVLPAVGTCWPVGASGVTVLVRAGYEPDDTVPGNIRRAMLVLISGYDSDREGGDIFAKAEASARSLCSRLKLRSL